MPRQIKMPEVILDCKTSKGLHNLQLPIHEYLLPSSGFI